VNGAGAGQALSPPPSLKDGPEKAEEHAATAAITALLACVYRLFKVARMYDASHQILIAETETAANAIAEFCTSQEAESADLVFVGETFFVNGQMPRFPREAYLRAMELGELLDRCGISNLTIAKTVTPSNIHAFVTVIAGVLRDSTRRTDLSQSTFVGLRARRLRARVGGDAAEVDQSPAARVVRTYACAIVVLRQFYEAFSGGAEPAKMPATMRRIAQRIVTHAEQEPVMLVGLAAGKSHARDEAAVATGTALVAVLMARQLTADRGTLTNLTLAAMLYDLGRQDLLKGATVDRLLDASMRTLSEEDQDRVAGTTALAVASLERVDPQSMPRAVMTFEAHWIRRAPRLGPLYRGRRAACALARILATARSFCELMAPGPYATPMGPEDAIQFLGSRAVDESERTFVKLLTGALGIFTPGTTVELTTREIGVVTVVPESAIDFSRPPVRVMYDGQGNKLEEPFDVDLAAPPKAGEPERAILRTFDADQQQSQAMRAYVLAVTSTHRSRQQPDVKPVSQPDPDSRSGKREIAARAAEVTMSAPDRSASRPGVDSRPRVPTGGAFDDRPAPSDPLPAASSRPLDSRPERPAPPSSGVSRPATFEDRPPTSRDAAARVPAPVISALDERPPTSPSQRFRAPPSSSSDLSPPSAPPSAPSSQPDVGTGKRGAWKERQASRAAVRDSRAEEDAPPSIASIDRVAIPTARASSPSAVEAPQSPPSSSSLGPPSRPSGSRPSASFAGVNPPDRPSSRSMPAADVPPPPTSSRPEGERPTARPPSPVVSAMPTQPHMPRVQAEVPTEPPPPPELTPAPARRPLVFSGSVAGTRKVAWGDYDKIVDLTAAEPPIEPAPVTPRAPAPGQTRRATWEEAEALAQLSDDETPEDEGI